MLALSAVVACTIDPPEGRFACDRNEDCPDGWSCVSTSEGNRCFREPIDASIGMDTGGMDAEPIDAMTDSGADDVTTSDTLPADAPDDSSDSAADADIPDTNQPDAGGLPSLFFTFGGSGIDEARGVAVGPLGTIFVVGLFHQSIAIGTEVLASTGASDAFLASFEPDGTLRFATSFGRTGGDYFNGVTVLGDLVCATGSFVGGVDVGGGPLPIATGVRGAVVACYDFDGQHMWSTGFGRATARGIGNDGSRLVVTGDFIETIEVGATSLVSEGDWDVFVGSWRENGTLEWIQGTGTSGADFGFAVDANSERDIVAVGLETPTSGSECALLRYAPGGGARVHEQFGSDGADAMRAVAVEGASTCAGGNISGRTDFGDGWVIEPPIGGEAFMGCFATRIQETRWAVGFESPQFAVVYAADIHEGSVWAAGNFEHSIDLTGSGTAIDSMGDRDGFVVELNLANGAAMRHRTLGGAGRELIRGVAAYGNGVYLVGDFSEMMELDGEQAISAGMSDAFIYRFQ